MLKGIRSTDVPAHLQMMVDSLVWESSRTEEGATGACLEYLLKNDVLGTLVKLSESDRPSGIQAEVLQAVQNMVVLLDEQFLVHSAVHRAVLRLLRNCVGDDIQEQLDGRTRVMGAAKNAARSQPSEYELDLVNLLCILCSRIRTYRELLMIFFHDKHWYRSEPLFSVEEEDEEDEDEEEDDQIKDKVEQGEDKSSVEASEKALDSQQTSSRSGSPTPSQNTITSAPTSQRKTEYEFLLFNYLLRFVHREGQIGDFARAGLLFLMDVAMSPGEPVHRLTGDTSSASQSASASATVVNDPIADAAIALAEYIIDGDFSEVLGAGLGAVYSLLPSKLEVRSATYPNENAGSGMVLGSTGPLNEEEIEKREAASETNRGIGLEDSSNPDFKFRLDHFLKILEFLQDIFRRNVIHDSAESSLNASTFLGTSIVHSILDAVRRIYLQNVLYPTILECSDSDGSAVAVMSYIDIIIRTLEDGQLLDLFVRFLMSEDNDEVSRPIHRQQGLLNLSNNAPPQASVDRKTKHARRKSSAMTLLEMEAPDSRKESEYFTSMGRFTLKDLLLSNLRSSNQATATAAFQLLQSVVTICCRHSVDGLLLVIRDERATSFPQPIMLTPPATPSGERRLLGDDDSDEEFIYPGGEDKMHSVPAGPFFAQPTVTISTHEREMGLYLTLVSRVDPAHHEDAFSTGYDHYLRDAMLSIQSHSCFFNDISMDLRRQHKHRLNVTDPILSLLLESMRKFFANSPKLNISLTAALAALAVCPDRSLSGWLTFAVDETSRMDTTSPVFAVGNDGDDRSMDWEIEDKLVTETNILPASKMDDRSRPIVHAIIQGLVGQLERYRQVVEDFDKYLLERRQGLLFSENLTDAMTLALEPAESPPIPSLVSPPGTPAPKPKPKASSLVSFLTPRKSKTMPAKVANSDEPSTPPKTTGRLSVSTPFSTHYEQTRHITVEPFLAPVPSSASWMSKKSARWNTDDDDLFAASRQWGDGPPETSVDEEDEEDQEVTHVSLSHLLDNVVILEECIKELVAIIHARRSLGIDSVRYM